MAFRDKEFYSAPSGKLNTKISTQIDGQLPDFIQSDHPVFSRFLKHYYQYLEAGELRLKVTIGNILLELETTSYALDVDGYKIVVTGPPTCSLTLKSEYPDYLGADDKIKLISENT